MTEVITRTPRRLVVTRTNRVQNPRAFVNVDEYSSYATGGGPVTITRGTGVGSPISGQAARGTLTATNTGSWGIGYEGIRAQAGEVLTLSAYMRATNFSTGSLGVVAIARDGLGANLGQYSGSVQAGAVAGTWYRREVTTPPLPAGTVTVALQMRVTNGGAVGNVIEANGLLAEDSPAPAGTYFDGSTPDAPPLYWRWVGTPHKSESTENIIDARDVLTPELIEGYEASARARSNVHQTLRGSASAVTVLPVEPKSGNMNLLFLTQAEALNAFDVLGQAATFTLVSSLGAPVDMVFACADGNLGIRLDPVTRRRWLVSVPFKEVK